MSKRKACIDVLHALPKSTVNKRLYDVWKALPPGKLREDVTPYTCVPINTMGEEAPPTDGSVAGATSSSVARKLDQDPGTVSSALSVLRELGLIHGCQYGAMGSYLAVSHQLPVKKRMPKLRNRVSKKKKTMSKKRPDCECNIPDLTAWVQMTRELLDQFAQLAEDAEVGRRWRELQKDMKR